MNKTLQLVILILAVVGLVFGVNYYIDYKNDQNLTNLAKDHPKGEEYLNLIKEAEAKLKESGLSDEEKFDMYAQVAFYAHSLGDEKRAVVEYKKCLQIDPKNLVILNNIAFSYRELKDYKNAEKSFRQIIAINPHQIATYRNLADLYRYWMEGKKDQVDDVILEGLMSNLDHPDLLSYLAVYYQEEGDDDLAIQYYVKLLKVYPENVAAQEELKKLQGK